MPKANPIPEGMTAVTPHIVCADANAAIDFYKKAFGATDDVRMHTPDGKLMHGMIRIGGAPIMLAEENPQWNSIGPKTLKGTPVTIHLYVENVDAFVDHAVKSGAKITMPIQDMFWGDRFAVLECPYGHCWSVATHTRDVAPAEMKEAMKSMGP